MRLRLEGAAMTTSGFNTISAICETQSVVGVHPPLGVSRAENYSKKSDISIPFPEDLARNGTVVPPDLGPFRWARDMMGGRATVVNVVFSRTKSDRMLCLPLNGVDYILMVTRCPHDQDHPSDNACRVRLVHDFSFSGRPGKND